MEQLNEFKFSTLRQFGSESITFSATVHSKNMALSDEEIKEQLNMIDTLLKEEFTLIQEREISEKEALTLGSEKRTATVRALDDALKAEMQAGNDAKFTMKKAEQLSNKINKNK